MPSVRKAAKAAPFNPADVKNVTKAGPYVQRIVEDEELRDNVRTAFDSTKSAFNRLTDGKAPHKALFEDKRLQKDLKEAYEAVRDATNALADAPKRKAKRGLRLGRAFLIVGVTSGLALAGSEQLRTKVLDTLFGAEDEFQYTPPASTSTTTESTSAVGAA